MFTVITAESACLAFAAVISRIYLSDGRCRYSSVSFLIFF